jgi:hypothetical protein
MNAPSYPTHSDVNAHYNWQEGHWRNVLVIYQLIS